MKSKEEARVQFGVHRICTPSQLKAHYTEETLLHEEGT